MNYDQDFQNQRNIALSKIYKNKKLMIERDSFFQSLVDVKYSYNFDWMGVPIIQMPSDLIVFQEIAFQLKPDVVIEVGVARGGSVLFWASMLELFNKSGKVIGVDIDIRNHTRLAIEESIFANRIILVEGDSSDKKTFDYIKKLIEPNDKVLVVLDSNHTELHVMRELELFSNLVTVDSYLIVLDTVIEKLRYDEDKPWGQGNNPMTAVEKFMKDKDDIFQRDISLENKSLLTVAPNGFYRKVN